MVRFERAGEAWRGGSPGRRAEPPRSRPRGPGVARWLMLGLLIWPRLAAASAPGDAPEQHDAALQQAFEGILADAARAGECARTWSCCLGSPHTMGPEVWHHVKKFAINYHRRELLDSTPRMLERYYYVLPGNVDSGNLCQMVAEGRYTGMFPV